MNEFRFNVPTMCGTLGQFVEPLTASKQGIMAVESVHTVGPFPPVYCLAFETFVGPPCLRVFEPITGTAEVSK